MAKRRIEMAKQPTTTTSPSAVDVPTPSVSLRDFRSWLAGVEEMQDTDWHPTAEQWRRIRAKIDLIKEEPLVVSKQPTMTSTSTVSVPSSTFERVSPPAAPVRMSSTAPMATSDGQTVRTPSDTTGAPYKTSFA